MKYWNNRQVKAIKIGTTIQNTCFRSRFVKFD